VCGARAPGGAPVYGHQETLEKLKGRLSPGNPFPGFGQAAVPSYMAASGFGLNLVRKTRIRFAHGASRFPLPANAPDGWSGKRSQVPDFLALNTRVVLFTIQMLLDGGRSVAGRGN